MALAAKNENKPTTLSKLRPKAAIMIVLLCASGSEKQIERPAHPARSGFNKHPNRCEPSEWPCRRAQYVAPRAIVNDACFSWTDRHRAAPVINSFRFGRAITS